MEGITQSCFRTHPPCVHAAPAEMLMRRPQLDAVVLQCFEDEVVVNCGLWFLVGYLFEWSI